MISKRISTNTKKYHKSNRFKDIKRSLLLTDWYYKLIDLKIVVLWIFIYADRNNKQE